ncbi:hypothetical protein JB92DRAFT_3112761 [Gautieria morchelliformis]|nr:hypothetical protein JB92DRAFT_3112761 [Gautieria morchelliformis]
MRLEGELRARSDSLGSTYSSDVQENTPSPLDPEGIRLWEEQHAETRSRTESSGSGSYRDDDSVENGQDKVVIDPALMSTSQLSHSYSSYGYDATGGSRWEEQHSETRSHNVSSSGSGSFRDDDGSVENGQGNVVIDSTLMSTSRSSCSYSSYAYDARGTSHVFPLDRWMDLGHCFMGKCVSLKVGVEMSAAQATRAVPNMPKTLDNPGT